MWQASKGTRIRQGGPDEDKALAAHMLELVPNNQLLSEAAQLCELLILLRHEADAGILQQVGSPCCSLPVTIQPGLIL